VDASNGGLTEVPVPVTLIVDPAPLTITVDNQTKTYGDSFTFISTEFSTTGLQNGDTIGSVTLSSAGATPTAGVANSPYAIVPSNPTGGTFNASNYDITYVDGSLTVTPAALTIMADDQTKPFGQSFFFQGTEFTAIGLLNGDTVGTVTLSSAGTVPTANVANSPYTITVSNATGGTFNPGNYTITDAEGSLTVTPAALTITADDQTKPFGQSFSFQGSEFTVTGLQNGDTISSVTLSSDGTTTRASVGSHPIMVSSAMGGSATLTNYTITYVSGTLTVLPVPSGIGVFDPGTGRRFAGLLFVLDVGTT
jgi:MBG domain (YGX type)